MASKIVKPAIINASGAALKQTITIASSIVLIPIVTTLLNTALTHDSSRQQDPAIKPEALAKRLNPKMIQVLSFGHTPTVTDWIWIEGLLDPTLTHVKKGEHADLFYVANLVTDIDRANMTAYIASAMLLTVVRNDNTGARDLLVKAGEFDQRELKNYPEDFRKRFWNQRWAIYLTLAYVHLFELNDMSSAAKAFQDAAKIPGAPEYLKQLSERFQRPGGQYEVGLRLINFMLPEAKKPEAREALERKKYFLNIARYRAEADQAFRNYLSTQPRYRSKLDIPASELNAYWKAFRKSNQVPAVDPWGGKLYLDETGHVATTTPYEKVFGLE